MTDSSASRNVEAPSREELVAFVREQRDNCYRLGKNGEGLADLFERLGYKDSVALYEGVRTRIEELSRELAVSDKLLEERNRVLRAIPGCDAHGDQCVPHALEWIEDALRAAKSAERTSEPVAWRSRLLLDLDRMIESVNEDIQKEAGNYGTLAHLGGELKGLMAARAYAELDSARSAIRTTAPTPPSDAGKDAFAFAEELFSLLSYRRTHSLSREVWHEADATDENGQRVIAFLRERNLIENDSRNPTWWRFIDPAKRARTPDKVMERFAERPAAPAPAEGER